MSEKTTGELVLSICARLLGIGLIFWAIYAMFGLYALMLAVGAWLILPPY